MRRYKVVRKDVRYNHRTFHKGEFMPLGFSERDKYKLLYPSRVEAVEVADPVAMTTPTVGQQKTIAAAAQNNGAPRPTMTAPKPGVVPQKQASPVSTPATTTRLAK